MGFPRLQVAALRFPPDLPFPCLSFSTQSPVQGLVVY